MASLRPEPAWEELPNEILLDIIKYLEPRQLPRLHLVSRRLRDVSLDDDLWKRHCFDSSTWYHFLKNRRFLRRLQKDGRAKRTPTVAPGVSEEGGGVSSNVIPSLAQPNMEEPTWRQQVQQESVQDMKNWDPVFAGEYVSWYDEYIHRHGPSSVNWLESPRLRDGGLETLVEARGVAIYNPNNGNDGVGTMLAVSPLDDGSVCLWDVNGSHGCRGGILAKSRPDILFFNGPGIHNMQRSRKIDTGVTDCVSINNNGHRAFFAVQSHLLEVDLNRLEVVSQESFEWSITTLSPIHDGVPLTVGTSLGIHLHDFRAQARVSHDVVERIDAPVDNPFKVIFDSKPLPPYASLSQPTPISILHLPRPGQQDVVSDDIYVAGRFSSILHYDRRKFPRIVDSIHSGARLSSLAALPYPLNTGDSLVRLKGTGMLDEGGPKIDKNDRTLIAGGEYKTKGSLELYRLSSSTHPEGSSALSGLPMKNRHTAASSTILSVTNHGSKIVVSDGAGLIKWFERDGRTEVRRLKIGHSEGQTQSSLFASMPGSDDLARKIISTKPKQGDQRPNSDNILFWTGEKLGLVSFTNNTLFKAEDFEVQDPEASKDEEKRQLYADKMREALERQADEARFVRGLGLGPRPG